ncbi:MAG: carbohydrate ABC transporter permease [Clostridiaceae bacterium]|nr:carbohydrate ABC transporter permease [Clostridiaceae bacterium]
MEKAVALNKSKPTRKIVMDIIIYAILIAISAVILIPLFWMISTALKSNADIFKWPPEWIPNPPHWENIANAWNAMPFNKFLQNSLFIVVLGVTAEVISETIVAYGFARYDFPGKNIIFILLLSTMMLPAHVTLIPTYIIWNKIGLIGEFDPLVLRAWTAWGPFYIFLMRQFFMGIPKELDDAADIDGASLPRKFFQIMLPQIKPILAAISVFAFRGYFNEFQGPLIYLSDKEKYTMTLGMYFFMGGVNEAPKWNYLMVIALIIALPSIVLYFAAQKYFIEGITFTGLKD